MITVPGYEIFEKLSDDINSAVYRGLRKADRLPVILKLLKGEFPTQEQLGRFKREYEMTRRLDLDGTCKVYSLEKLNNSLAIAMEDFGGDSLSNILSTHRLNLSEFLYLAVQITEIIVLMHQKNVMHKDINPANIIWDRKSDQLKIVDFGIATSLVRENTEISSPNVLEGTLAYISPEQTGRMNRAVDYRTDIYSLGVTFYEMLTGALPFNGTDAMEMVHCHIAKTPISPVETNPQIPKVLSDIIDKMMSKRAEDRYQSALGLQIDLQNCLDLLNETGGIQYFAIAQHDLSGKFQIPQELYGREKEIYELLASFDNVAHGEREMVLVVGFAGVGKSSLVHEIHKPIVQNRGYFISGKFDQLKRNTPFEPLIRAFKELIRQLLTESHENLILWKEKLEHSLGPNGQIIIDVIPEVELIIGKQPAIQEMPPVESQNRFNLVFLNFIRSFAAKDHPLAVFLDDLQSADLSSLKLIEMLMSSPATNYIIFIGALRENELTAAHPLMTVLEAIRISNTAVKTINLTPLSLQSVNRLISDTLKCKQDLSLPLSEICLAKTGGNPFFLNQFLLSLYKEGVFEFVTPQSPQFKEGISVGWHWDINRVNLMEMTDNVVDLMTSKILNLQERTQHILQLAASIGSRFDLNILSIVNEKTPSETVTALWEALQEGLIIPANYIYKYFDDTGATPQVNYLFLHDRVHQAAYSLIPENMRLELHLKIGRLLLEQIPEIENDERFFDVVNHLNIGVELINDPMEIENIARLNLAAGSKAKASGAYEPALVYFTNGLRLVAEDMWEKNYSLALSLHLDATEISCLCGDYTSMDKLSNVVIQKARDILDTVKVYEVRIMASILEDNPLQAVNTALTVLNLLGIKFPQHPNKLHIVISLLKTKLLLLGKTIESLVDLPKMTDTKMLAAIRIMTSVTSAAYQAAPELYPLSVLKRVRMSLKYGNAPYSCDAYSGYGLIICSVLGDIDNGYRFAKLAEDLTDKLPAGNRKAVVNSIVHFLIKPWKDDLQQTIKPLLDAYHYGLDTGNFEWAGISLWAYIAHLYYTGENLETLEKIIGSYQASITQIRQEMVSDRINIYHQAILNLKDGSESPCKLVGDVYDEEFKMPSYLNSNLKTPIALIHFNKLIISVIFGEYDLAVQNADMASKYLDGMRSMPAIPIYYFMDSLARLGLYQSTDKTGQKHILNIVEANQKKIKKWADKSQNNILHKFHLVEAEKARVLDLEAIARDHYNKAIESAGKHGFIHEEALANELAAGFWLGKGLNAYAHHHMKNAHYGWQQWGANAKVRQLEHKYPFLLSMQTQPTSVTTGKTTHTLMGTAGKWSQTLDLASVMKASQAISGEIVLEKLLINLMKIVVENAGAEEGFLILENKGTMRIRIHISVENDKVSLLDNVLVDDNDQLSQSIVNYTTRTHESIVLGDAAVTGIFTQDDYVLKKRPKSILCMPILHHGKLVGALYLENNQITDAFTPDRVEILKILSSQAAISIQNALLYENITKEIAERKQAELALRKSEEKYRTIFDNASEGIFQTLPDGTLLTANSALAKILGYDSIEEGFEYLNSTVTNVYVDLSRRQEFINQLRENISVSDFQYQARRKDGRIIDVSVNAHLVVDDNGELLYIEGMLEDITEKNQADKLKIAKEAAEAATLAKSDFLATMSHEIRTPMNAILGMAELLAETELSKEQADYVLTFKASGEQLLSLINDILDFSKIEAGKVDLEAIPFNLTEQAEIVCRILALRASEKGIKLSCSTAPDVYPFRIGDPTRLRQIFMNLLGNAVKFTNKGEVTLEISQIEGSIDPDKILFCVRDTGIGIPQDKILSIFDSFSQADTSTSRKFGGTGLGLAITKQLVGLMGGVLCVESEENIGSKFSFSAILPKTASLVTESAETVNTDDDRIYPIRILYAEDIEANRKLVYAFLKGLPVEMDTAENGKQAVEMFITGGYDLVFMDMEMPVMDGLEATETIRKWELEQALEETPIIALTAHAFAEHHQKCIDAGCNGLLLKPFKKKELIDLIGRISREINPLPYTETTSLQQDDSKIDIGSETYKAKVDAIYKDLIPGLFEDIHQEMEAMRQAVKQNDYDTLVRLAHGLKGAAGNYELSELAKIFLSVEKAVKCNELGAIGDYLKKAAFYIDNVEIEYME